MITIETPGFIQNISPRILAPNMVCVPPDFGPPAPGLTRFLILHYAVTNLHLSYLH